MSELVISMDEFINNSYIYKQKELNFLFFDLYKNFLDLLKNKNNNYKKTDIYFEKIVKLIKENFSIIDCSVFILICIYNERIKYVNKIDNVALEFEKEIIEKALFILQNKINVKIMINNINSAFCYKIEEKYHELNKKKFGVDVIIDYEELQDINIDNIEKIYVNYSNFNHLNNLRKNNCEKNMVEKFKLFDNYDSYLFCFYYFSINK
jgi:hypothetical protein